MPYKALIINGSHRKDGRSDTLSDTVHNAFMREGMPSSQIILRELRIEYCRGNDLCEREHCNLCGEGCDDMTEIYKQIEASNILILTSPIYFSNISSRLKTFIERAQPYFNNISLRPKKLISAGICCVGEQREESFAPVINEAMRFYFKTLGLSNFYGCYIGKAKESFKPEEKVFKHIITPFLESIR